MPYQVVFSPEALAQLEALYGYVAQAASPDIATPDGAPVAWMLRKLGHAGL